MSRLGVLVIAAACGASPPAVPNTVIPTTPAAVARCEPGDEPPSREGADPRLASLIDELERIDRELDAIDDELAAAARLDGMTIGPARAAATELLAALATLSIDVPHPAAPRRLAAMTTGVLRARVRRAQLDHDGYGRNHPEMIATAQHIAFLEERATQQLADEQRFAHAWSDALAALPAKAKPAAVASARLAAVRATLAAGGIPSDVPAELRVAADRVDEATWNQRELAVSVGPKHPSLIAANQALEAAITGFHEAVGYANGVLAMRMLEPARAVDPRVISRRAELSAASRELRREYLLVR